MASGTRGHGSRGNAFFLSTSETCSSVYRGLRKFLKEVHAGDTLYSALEIVLSPRREIAARYDEGHSP